MQQAITAMETAFIQLAQDKALSPLRTPVPIKEPQGLMLTMPAFMADQQALGVKVVSIFPANTVKNLPAINGVILLVDAASGETKALMEASFLTALRTGAVSGLATRYLAKADAKQVAIIGAGAQALTQLEAIAAVRPIEKVSVWSRNHANAVAFAQKITGRYDITCARTIQQAVKEAEIICTATASTEALIHLPDIGEQVHINAVGSHTPAMCEISNEVMAHAQVVVDKREAALAEAGEVISALEAGCLKRDDVLELGELVLAPAKARQGLTVFKSVGLAIQDISIAHVVFDNAIAQGIGTQVSL